MSSTPPFSRSILRHTHPVSRATTKNPARGVWTLLVWLSAAPLYAGTEAETDFARAYQHYSAGDHARAKPLFRSALDDSTLVLRDYVLFHLGRIAVGERRYKEARGYFAELQESCPGSVWCTEAWFAFVELDLAGKRREAAVRRAAALGKTASGRTARARAAYYLGQAHEALGNHRKAYRRHQEARRRAPRSVWAGRARERVRQLRREHPEQLGLRGGDAMLREAGKLQREREYAAAAELYRRILRETRFRRLSLEGLADVYRKMRRRDQEEQILRRYIKHYPQRARAGAALTRIAVIQWNREDNAGALETLRTFRRKYPGHARQRFAVYITGRIHESMGRRKAAIRTYRRLLAKEHRFSRFRGDAAWRLGWLHYLAADYPPAKARFHDLAGRRGAYRTAAVFWEARTAEKLEDVATAARLYRRVVREAPESYYAVPASRRLAGLGAAVAHPPPPEPATPAAGAPRLGARAGLHLARAHALMRLGLNRLAHGELDRVRRHAKRTAGVTRLLMREYARSRAHHRGLSLALRSPTSPETRRLRYPLAYWDIVRRHANDVDPYLVLSLMRQESRFQRRAVSPANAFGLMQLIRETADREAAKMGLPEPETPQLFDPELNIRLGVHHLKGLLQYYAGNRVRALAAYNAGKEAVARWTRNFASDDDAAFIERISYRETRQYVKAVLRNYHVYRTLYRGAAACGRSPAPPKRCQEQSCRRRRPASVPRRWRLLEAETGISTTNAAPDGPMDHWRRTAGPACVARAGQQPCPRGVAVDKSPPFPVLMIR